jgi:hypothetical protein
MSTLHALPLNSARHVDIPNIYESEEKVFLASLMPLDE